ncbi:MAG: hypothetical protein Q9169_004562 [Polycauliona sp. 2 TL-2023]
MARRRRACGDAGAACAEVRRLVRAKRNDVERKYSHRYVEELDLPANIQFQGVCTVPSSDVKNHHRFECGLRPHTTPSINSNDFFFQVPVLGFCLSVEFHLKSIISTKDLTPCCSKVTHQSTQRLVFYPMMASGAGFDLPEMATSSFTEAQTRTATRSIAASKKKEQDLRITRSEKAGLPYSPQTVSDNEKPPIWLHKEALSLWNPMIDPKPDFCCLPKEDDLIDQEKAVVLAVDDGDRPTTAENSIETVLVKTAFDSDLTWLCWTIEIGGRRYIVKRNGKGEIRRLLTAQQQWDFHAFAFVKQVTLPPQSPSTRDQSSQTQVPLTAGDVSSSGSIAAPGQHKTFSHSQLMDGLQSLQNNRTQRGIAKQTHRTGLQKRKRTAIIISDDDTDGPNDAFRESSDSEPPRASRSKRHRSHLQSYHPRNSDDHENERQNNKQTQTLDDEFDDSDERPSQLGRGATPELPSGRYEMSDQAVPDSPVRGTLGSELIEMRASQTGRQKGSEQGGAELSKDERKAKSQKQIEKTSSEKSKDEGRPKSRVTGHGCHGVMHTFPWEYQNTAWGNSDDESEYHDEKGDASSEEGFEDGAKKNSDKASRKAGAATHHEYLNPRRSTRSSVTAKSTSAHRAEEEEEDDVTNEFSKRVNQEQNDDDTDTDTDTDNNNNNNDIDNNDNDNDDDYDGIDRISDDQAGWTIPPATTGLVRSARFRAAPERSPSVAEGGKSEVSEKGRKRAASTSPSTISDLQRTQKIQLHEAELKKKEAECTGLRIRKQQAETEAANIYTEHQRLVAARATLEAKLNEYTLSINSAKGQADQKQQEVHNTNEELQKGEGELKDMKVRIETMKAGRATDEDESSRAHRKRWTLIATQQAPHQQIRHHSTRLQTRSEDRTLVIPNDIPADGPHQIFLLQYAQGVWSPVFGQKPPFCWVLKNNDPLQEEMPVLLAVNDGEEPLTNNETFGALLVKRIWDTKSRWAHWVLVMPGERFIADVHPNGEVRRLLTETAAWDFHAFAFTTEISPIDDSSKRQKRTCTLKASPRKRKRARSTVMKSSGTPENDLSDKASSSESSTPPRPKRRGIYRRNNMVPESPSEAQSDRPSEAIGDRKDQGNALAPIADGSSQSTNEMLEPSPRHSTPSTKSRAIEDQRQKIGLEQKKLEIMEMEEMKDVAVAEVKDQEAKFVRLGAEMAVVAEKLERLKTEMGEVRENMTRARVEAEDIESKLVKAKAEYEALKAAGVVEDMDL